MIAGTGECGIADDGSPRTDAPIISGCDSDHVEPPLAETVPVPLALPSVAPAELTKPPLLIVIVARTELPMTVRRYSSSAS